MKIARSRAEMAEYIKEMKPDEMGFVPTMGALHRGHLSLVECARRECDSVVVSIFVNPTQFNDSNDLKSYPRTPEADLEALERAGVDVVFMPSIEEVYPEPDERVFNFGALDSVMEGASRKGHFNGVAQVMSRLLEQIPASKIYMGEKDYQQVVIIRAMVEKLGMQREIISCSTVRESDGLAMSSRNTLLDEKHRRVAPIIYTVMREVTDLLRWYIEQGDDYILGDGMSPREVEKLVSKRIEVYADGLLKVLYFKIVNEITLDDVQSWDEEGGARGCVAVQAGGVRLIDNIKMV